MNTPKLPDKILEYIYIERLNMQINNGQIIFDNNTLQHLSGTQNTISAAICPKQSGFGKWLPVSLIFAHFATLGPTKKVIFALLPIK